MKKKLFLITALSSLLLVGCTSAVNDANISDEDVTEEVLNLYNANFNKDSGHILDEDTILT